MADPRRMEEAREWFDASIRLMVKDGLRLRLTGTRLAVSARFAEVLVQGELHDAGDRPCWKAEHTFEVPKGAVVTGFEGRTPEGELVVTGRVAAEDFRSYAGTYHLIVSLDWTLTPLENSPL